MLYFLVIYVILITKYIEENLTPSKSLEDDHLWIDIEQSLFNLINNLLNRQYNSPKIFSIFFHYCSELLLQLTNQTKDFDNYINLEKFIEKMKPQLNSISNINNDDEKLIFKNTQINLLKETFDKSEELRFKKETHNFIIDLIFSVLLTNKDFMIKNNKNLKTIFKNSRVFSTRDNKSGLIFDDSEIVELMNNKKYINLKNYLDCYFSYMSNSTCDVTECKRIWREVEEYLNEAVKETEYSFIILEIVLIYIFNKLKKSNISNVGNNNLGTNIGNTNIGNTGITGNTFRLSNQGVNKNNANSKSQAVSPRTNNNLIIMSSIFEFICDKLNLTETPEIFNSDMNIRTKSINILQHNLHLYNEIVCNHLEFILNDQISSERYLVYFARIFIEDTILDVSLSNTIINISNTNSNITNINEIDNKINRLYEFILNTADPYKFVISLITNIGKFFKIQAENEIIPDDSKKKLMNEIYKKIIYLLNKFPRDKNFDIYDSHQFNYNYDRALFDPDEIFMILFNFSTGVKALRQNYILFYIKFFIFVDMHFKIEFEFIHRKKLFLTIYEMFYELIINSRDYDDIYVTVDEFIKLMEMLLVIVKTYSKGNFEDAYLIYKMNSMVYKKILVLLSGGNNNEELKDNKDGEVLFDKTQYMFIYCLVNLTMQILVV